MNNENKLYFISYLIECPCFSEILEDPSFRLSKDASDSLLKIWNNPEEYAELIEGNEEGDNWAENALGEIIIDAYRIPTYEHPTCGHIVCSHRQVPLLCNDNIKAILRKMPHFPSPSQTEVGRLIEQINTEFRKAGHDVDLLPGDELLPVVWKDSLFLDKYEVFGLKKERRNLSWVMNLRMANRFRDAGFSGMKFQQLEMCNRFYPENTNPFFLVTCTEPKESFDRIQAMMEREQGCHLMNPNAIQTCMYCGKDLREYVQDREKKIAFNKMCSGFKKKKILPRRYVPEAVMFKHPAFCSCSGESVILKPEAYALFQDVDMSYAKITTINITDNGEKVKRGRE